MNTRRLGGPLMLVVATFAVAACSPHTGTDSAGTGGEGTDSAFLKTAIEGNIAEVQMGTLAEQRTSGEVQAYADMLVTEHRRALDRTTTLAEEMNMTTPEQPPADAQSKYARLAEISGSEFEREFVDTMVMNHESTIEKYRSYLQTAGSGSDVASYAQQTLPVLEKHLQTARSLQGRQGGETNGAGAGAARQPGTVDMAGESDTTPQEPQQPQQQEDDQAQDSP